MKESEINKLFRDQKWDEAVTVILDSLKEYPDNHWLFTRLASIYAGGKGNYIAALEYAEKALKLEPKCPLVLWDYAGILYVSSRNEDASRIYKRLIRRPIKSIAYGKCGQGIRWARSLKNDSRYQLGLIYASYGQFRLAARYIKAHISRRGSNCPSSYNLREVKKDLIFIQRGENPYIS
jgi:predicted Zn-dependent protease